MEEKKRRIQLNRPSGAQQRKTRIARGLPGILPSEKVYRDRARVRNREFLSTYKLERGCVDCGYRAHHAALEFDHLPGTMKVGDLASMATALLSIASLLVEIEKCEIVCSNCHHIRTYNRAQRVKSLG